MSKVHKDALLSVLERKAMVEAAMIYKLTWVVASRKYNVSVPTVWRWVSGYPKEGESGSKHRSSRPHTSPIATPLVKAQEIISRKKKKKMSGDYIARKLNIHQRTVSSHLIRANQSRQKDVESSEEERSRRYRHNKPKDLIHFNIKKFWNFNKEGIRTKGNGKRHYLAKKAASTQGMHFEVIGRTRIATVCILEEETTESLTHDLIEDYQKYVSRENEMKRVLLDYGLGDKSKMFEAVCKKYTVKQVFTKQYTQQTNGYVKRFIQKLLREWAYVGTYTSSEQQYVY